MYFSVLGVWFIALLYSHWLLKLHVKSDSDYFVPLSNLELLFLRFLSSDLKIFSWISFATFQQPHLMLNIAIKLLSTFSEILIFFQHFSLEFFFFKFFLLFFCDNCWDLLYIIWEINMALVAFSFLLYLLFA